MKHDEIKNNPEISPGRKALYYLGLGLMALGFLLFLIGFVSLASAFGDLSGMGFGTPRGILLPFVGVVLVIVGGVLRGVGARGLAGSGVLLDPRKAREDLNPYTHAAGGMVQDAVKGFKEAAGASSPREVVKLRCPGCRALNEENAKFCSQCGQAL